MFYETKYFVKGINVKAIVSSKENQIAIFSGIQNERLTKVILPNESYQQHIDQIITDGYFEVGTAMINEKGKVISLDTFDSIYWELSLISKNNMSLFTDALRVFFNLVKTSEVFKEIKLIEDFPICKLKFDEFNLVGIDYQTVTNVFTLKGKGSGVFSISGSNHGVWLLLYLNSQQLIKINDGQSVFESRRDYPKWLLSFENSNPDLVQRLSLGNVFSKIKPINFQL